MRTFSALIFAFILVFTQAPLLSAQSPEPEVTEVAENTVTPRPTRPPKITKPIERIVTQRAASKEARMEKREAVSAKVQEEREKMKEEMEQKREEFREKLEEMKDEKKQAIVERIDKRLTTQNEAISKKLLSATERISKALVALEERLEAQEEPSKELTDAIAEAQSALEKAQTAIEEQQQKEYVIVLTDEENVGEQVSEAVTGFREDIKAVADLVREARSLAKDAVSLLTPAVEEE